MFRLTSSLHASGRARTLIATGLALAACLAVAAWTPSAQASGCTNTFTNTSGGSWFTAGNWSKEKVPTSGEEVCITERGNYTVEMAQGPSVTVKTLTVGALSGTQTLDVESTSGANAVLTTSEGLAIGADGQVVMTNASDSDQNSVTLSGPITNAGLLACEKGNGAGGSRTLDGNLTNTGTIDVDKNTEFNGESTSFTNEGALAIAEGVTLHASNKTTVLNGAGGKIEATGSADLLASGSGTTFKQGAGTTSGSLPVVVDDAALDYTGGGASLLALRGTSTLAGNLSAGQSLQIQSTTGENAHVSAAASLSNGGMIALTNAADGDQNSESLAIAKGQTLTNGGTLASEVGNGSGGGRAIEGSVTNTGTLVVDKNTEFDGEGALLTNDGTLEVATGVTLNVNNKAKVVNGTGGSIVGAGSGNVFVKGSETSFTQGAGTTSGTLPVIVDDSALKYEGAGASVVALRGTSTLAGNLSSGQSLQIQSTTGENAHVSAAASFSNGGMIALTNAADGDQNSESLAIAKGQTLTNGGTLASEVGNGSGGGRAIEGSVTNTGTLVVDKNTEFDGEGALLTNDGTLEVATGVTLNVNNKAKVVNGTGGSIVGAGSGNVFVKGSETSFTQGAGTTSGTLPVIVDDAALDYTGTGASVVALRGTSTLAGNLSSGQSLQIQSTTGENAHVSAAASLSNGGTIALTNAADGDQNSESLAIAKGATLTNSGTLASEVGNGSGGGRAIEGNVTNTGTLAANKNAEYEGTLLNEGKIVIASGVALKVVNSSTVTNGTGGNIEGVETGALSQHGGTFEEAAGKTTGTLPVILDDQTLKYTGNGASTIALRGTSTLSGPLSAGQTLLLQSTSGENANISSPSLTNSGTLAFENAADGDANNVALDLAGGTLTDAKGSKLDAEHGNGGNRVIEGSVTSEGTVAASTTLRVTGAFTMDGKKPILEITIAGASDFGALSVTGAATIANELELVQVKPFVPTVGEKFVILSSSNLVGTFKKLKKNKIKKAAAKLYAPLYSATSVTLEAQA